MSNKKSIEPQTSQIQLSIHTVPKDLVKEVSAPPFNVVDQMKKTNVNISIWDVVATIPSQKKLLKQELESIEMKDQPPREGSATRLVQLIKE